MTEQQFNEPPLSFLNEGFAMDHDSNTIWTWHVDFRDPKARTPIGPLVKYGEEQYAVERCGTIQLTRPPYFRREGETLILDTGEGFVTRRTVVRQEAPSAVKDAWTRSLGDAIDEAAESLGMTVLSKEITNTKATITDTDEDNFTWGNDYWLYCTAMRPTSDADRKMLLDSLDPKYLHESHIPSARTFAQMLGRAYVEAYGPPEDEMKPMNHSLDDGTEGTTYHRNALVAHGPVVYVDDPYEVCTEALRSRYSMTRTLLPIFTKGVKHSPQREYRFVILDKRESGTISKIMPATPELLAAYGRPGDSKGPMHVPDFHPANQHAAES